MLIQILKHVLVAVLMASTLKTILEDALQHACIILQTLQIILQTDVSKNAQRANLLMDRIKLRYV